MSVSEIRMNAQNVLKEHAFCTDSCDTRKQALFLASLCDTIEYQFKKLHKGDFDHEHCKGRVKS